MIPSSESSSGVFDPQASLEQIGNDPDLLEQMIAVFLEQLPRLLPPIELAVRQRDARAIRQTAHALCSSASVLTVTRAKESARQLEMMGYHAQLENVDRAQAALFEEVRLLEQVLKARTAGKAL